MNGFGGRTGAERSERVLLLERAFRILRVEWPGLVARLPGYVVGTLGAYWTIQRVAMLLRGVA